MTRRKLHGCAVITSDRNANDCYVQGVRSLDSLLIPSLSEGRGRWRVTRRTLMTGAPSLQIGNASWCKLVLRSGWHGM